jgi:hypothetical protein
MYYDNTIHSHVATEKNITLPHSPQVHSLGRRISPVSRTSMPTNLCNFLSVDDTLNGSIDDRRCVNQIPIGKLFSPCNANYMVFSTCYIPVMNAHGVGLRIPNDPSLVQDFSDRMGAEKVNVDRMAPMVGHM